MSESNADSAPSFDPAAIRRRLPNELTDKQERAVIAAIRNPDANTNELAHMTGLAKGTVHSALRSFARGTTGAEGKGESMKELRGSTRHAETYDELTPRQKAVVDFLARHGVALGEDVTTRTVAEAIAATDRYHGSDEFEADMSDTYPRQVWNKYGHLVPPHRERLEAMGEDVTGDPPEPQLASFSVRQLLEYRGVSLPDENLDPNRVAQAAEAIAEEWGAAAEGLLAPDTPADESADGGTSADEDGDHGDPAPPEPDSGDEPRPAPDVVDLAVRLDILEDSVTSDLDYLEQLVTERVVELDRRVGHLEDAFQNSIKREVVETVEANDHRLGELERRVADLEAATHAGGGAAPTPNGREVADLLARLADREDATALEVKVNLTPDHDHD